MMVYFLCASAYIGKGFRVRNKEQEIPDFIINHFLVRSVQKIRSGASVPATVSPFVEKEIAFHVRRCGNVRSFCHITPGCWINLKLVSYSHLKLAEIWKHQIKLSIQHLTCTVLITLLLYREVFRQEAAMQTWRRPFSLDSGDSVDVVVPPLADSISDRTLAKFLKKPGDRVNIDEPIAQIETDKVTIDVSSPESGVILKLLANEGDTVEPGNKIAIISRSADATTHVAPSETTPQKAAPQPTQKISEEKKAPKAEAAPVTEKPKASSATATASP
ncbi:hypothetical protein RIF29_00054 [Crotalaria pallida]|uniref:Lipoyl-binding domain-containing protein n=1 Tax=Crotalaria pallida TaxID=3830 RepID=A0AAN9P6U5_CROPI